MGFPLKWRGFGPGLQPIFCVLVYYCSSCFGNCLMIRTNIIIREEANK